MARTEVYVKAPPLMSDRQGQAGRDRVGRGSLPLFVGVGGQAGPDLFVEAGDLSDWFGKREVASLHEPVERGTRHNHSPPDSER